MYHRAFTDVFTSLGTSTNQQNAGVTLINIAGQNNILLYAGHVRSKNKLGQPFGGRKQLTANARQR